MKIAIVQPGCFGDNINSTLMLEPLKRHYEGCTIDVFTSTKYASAFVNNKFIDKVHQTEAKTKNDALNLVHALKPHGYDLVINSHPMVNKTWSSNEHPELGENLILAWVNSLEVNKVPYDLPLQTHLELTPHERNQADAFIQRLPQERKGIILMECEGESGQSFWHPGWTHDVILTLTQLGYLVLVSCIQQKDLVRGLQVQTMNKCVWVGPASIRVVAGMYDHCDAFISVSSGLSNACNTQQRRPVKHWFEVVNSMACSSNVVRTNEKAFWLENDQNAFCAMLREALG